MVKRNAGVKPGNTRLDLALVRGFTSMIRELAKRNDVEMVFDDLKMIERHERGARKQAIRYIRETQTPKSLGLRVQRTKSPSADPSLRLGKAIAKRFAIGQTCPSCGKGIMKTRADSLKGTVCDNCGIKTGEHRPVTGEMSADALFRKLHAHQVLSRWVSMNDPDPPRYARSQAA
jgi:hypothetical protein